MKEIIPNQVARKEVGNTKVWIPHVEAWYPNQIPISAVDRYFVVPNCREKSKFIEATIDEFE